MGIYNYDGHGHLIFVDTDIEENEKYLESIVSKWYNFDKGFCFPFTIGVENALFLEDDIFFSSSFIDLNNKCFTPLYKDILLEANQYDWDILQLGKKTPYQNGIFVGKYFVVPRYRSNFNGAHAYAVTRETLKTMSNQCLPIECAADVYLEKFYNTHNSLTLKESLIRQVSDVVDPQDSDSDTYYNDYRLGDRDWETLIWHSF